MPRYLHMPNQIIWFEDDEVAIIGMMLLLMNLIPGWITSSLVIILPALYMRTKRLNSRGYFRHALYRLGVFEIEGYPTYFAKDFRE